MNGLIGHVVWLMWSRVEKYEYKNPYIYHKHNAKMTNGSKIQQEARSNNETGERRRKTNLSIEE